TRVVFIGTPWANLDHFDLVVTTPQYGLPARANVVLNWLPLHAVHEPALSAAAAAWQKRFRHLPQPWIALLVGGSSGPYDFTPGSARRRGLQASQLAEDLGGSLLVTTSARTDPRIAQSLAASVSAPNFWHHWSRGGADNPYLAYLALADQIVVTADSISMIS